MKVKDIDCCKCGSKKTVKIESEKISGKQSTLIIHACTECQHVFELTGNFYPTYTEPNVYGME